MVVLKKGVIHQDGGPDFQNALISIDGHKWAGQVEIHISSSEWYKHNHHLDQTYDGTILHVVYTNDAEVNRSDGTAIPCLELQDRIDPVLIETYNALTNNSHHIPCERMLSVVESSTKIFTLEGHAIKRLEEKASPIFQKLSLCHNDWQEVFYQVLARSFGMRVNKLPFELLAKQISLHLLEKYLNEPLTIEALLYGGAGLLSPQYKDAYPRELLDRYAFLAHKHELQAIPTEQWKFLRLRPANFPTIRIGQFAALVQSRALLFSTISDDLTYDTLKSTCQITPNPYWDNHYRFDVRSKPKPKHIGLSLFHNLLINAVVPTFYCYGSQRNDVQLQEACIELMAHIPPEMNSTTKYFQQNGFKLDNAIHSQGALHLHQKFCIFKDCLKCQIGHRILRHL